MVRGPSHVKQLSPIHVCKIGLTQHRYELVKMMPLYSFPAAWNAEINEQFNPSQPVYLESLKNRLLANLNR